MTGLVALVGQARLLERRAVENPHVEDGGPLIEQGLGQIDVGPVPDLVLFLCTPLLILPAIYMVWKGAGLRRELRAARAAEGNA